MSKLREIAAKSDAQNPRTEHSRVQTKESVNLVLPQQNARARMPLDDISASKAMTSSRNAPGKILWIVVVIALALPLRAPLDNVIEAIWNKLRKNPYFQHDSWEPCLAVLAWLCFTAYWYGSYFSFQYISYSVDFATRGRTDVAGDCR